MAYSKNKSPKWATKKSVKTVLQENGFDVKNQDIRKSTTGRSWNIYVGNKLHPLSITNGNIESLLEFLKANN